jgi:hypothetical protein
MYAMDIVMNETDGRLLLSLRFFRFKGGCTKKQILQNVRSIAGKINQGGAGVSQGAEFVWCHLHFYTGSWGQVGGEGVTCRWLGKHRGDSQIPACCIQTAEGRSHRLVCLQKHAEVVA